MIPSAPANPAMPLPHRNQRAGSKGSALGGDPRGSAPWWGPGAKPLALLPSPNSPAWSAQRRGGRRVEGVGEGAVDLAVRQKVAVVRRAWREVGVVDDAR